MAPAAWAQSVVLGTEESGQVEITYLGSGDDFEAGAVGIMAQQRVAQRSTYRATEVNESNTNLGKRVDQNLKFWKLEYCGSTDPDDGFFIGPTCGEAEGILLAAWVRGRAAAPGQLTDNTGVDGVRWEVADDFDVNGTDANDSRSDFVVASDIDYFIGPTLVVAQIGTAEKLFAGFVPGPVCGTCVDPEDEEKDVLPNIDRFFKPGDLVPGLPDDGRRFMQITAPRGLRYYEIYNNDNLLVPGTFDADLQPVAFEALDAVSPGGGVLYQYVGGGEAPAEVYVELARADPSRHAQFYVAGTDCARTIDVDPILDAEPTAKEPVDVPTRFSLDQNYPNPFNPQTALAFALPEAAHAVLAVYDLTGREVARLVDGVLPSGRHTATWDGRDSAGRLVASGVYLYRLQTDGFAQTRRMTLLK